MGKMIHISPVYTIFYFLIYVIEGDIMRKNINLIPRLYYTFKSETIPSDAIIGQVNHFLLEGQNALLFHQSNK